MRHRPARPVPVRVDPKERRLVELVQAMSDDVRVVTGVHVAAGDDDLTALEVSTYGPEGLERFVGALARIETEVGLDEEGAMMETDLGIWAGPEEGAPGWVTFSWAIEDPERGGPPSLRLLRDVAAAVRHHRDGLSHREGNADRPRSMTGEPRVVAPGRLDPALKVVVDAFGEFGIRVMGTGWEEDRRTVHLDAAAHGSAGARALMDALRRAYVVTRLPRRPLDFECRLLWERADSPRCDFGRYPGWGIFSVVIGEHENGAGVSAEDLEGVAAAMRGRLVGIRRTSKRTGGRSVD